jgi:hypothetical protein
MAGRNFLANERPNLKRALVSEGKTVIFFVPASLLCCESRL